MWPNLATPFAFCQEFMFNIQTVHCQVFSNPRPFEQGMSDLAALQLLYLLAGYWEKSIAYIELTGIPNFGFRSTDRLSRGRSIWNQSGYQGGALSESAKAKGCFSSRAKRRYHNRLRWNKHKTFALRDTEFARKNRVFRETKSVYLTESEFAMKKWFRHETKWI